MLITQFINILILELRGVNLQVQIYQPIVKLYRPL